MYFQRSATSACRIHWNFGAGGLHLQRPMRRLTHGTLQGQPFSNVLRIVRTSSHMCHNILPQCPPDTPLIKALWVLSSMSTRRHQDALQHGTQPTPVVACWILHAPWSPRCSSKCPTMHLHVGGMPPHSGMHDPMAGVFTSHHGSITPPTSYPRTKNKCHAMHQYVPEPVVGIHRRCATPGNTIQALDTTSPSAWTITYTTHLHP